MTVRRPRADQILSCVMTVVFMGATVVGEAWHLVPGNRHYVALSGRRALPLGLRIASPDPTEARCGGWKLPPQSPAARGAQWCPICNLVAQGKWAETPFHYSPTWRLEPPPPPLALLCPCPAAGQPFEARAPPMLLNAELAGQAA